MSWTFSESILCGDTKPRDLTDQELKEEIKIYKEFPFISGERHKKLLQEQERRKLLKLSKKAMKAKPRPKPKAKKPEIPVTVQDVWERERG